MATKKKSELREQYSQILSQKGARLEDCSVLAFAFPKESNATSFHYAIESAEPAVPYLLFDCKGERAQVVIKNNSALEGRLKAMAEVYRGRRIPTEW